MSCSSKVAARYISVGITGMTALFGFALSSLPSSDENIDIPLEVDRDQLATLTYYIINFYIFIHIVILS